MYVLIWKLKIFVLWSYTFMTRRRRTRRWNDFFFSRTTFESTIGKRAISVFVSEICCVVDRAAEKVNRRDCPQTNHSHSDILITFSHVFYLNSNSSAVFKAFQSRLWGVGWLMVGRRWTLTMYSLSDILPCLWKILFIPCLISCRTFYLVVCGRHMCSRFYLVCRRFYLVIFSQNFGKYANLYKNWRVLTYFLHFTIDVVRVYLIC